MDGSARTGMYHRRVPSAGSMASAGPSCIHSFGPIVRTILAPRATVA